MASGLCFSLFFCLTGGLWIGANAGEVNPISTQRVITCDDLDNVQRLSCEEGVIFVDSVLYGRTNKKTCSDGRPEDQLADTNCRQDGTLEVLRTRCNGQTACEINTNVVRTSDPCTGIYKYLDTIYSCINPVEVVACEHSLAFLHCDKGQQIQVISANYGRSDCTTCSYERPGSQVQNVNCSCPADQVAASCDKKPRCSVLASNSVFGDPCFGTYKYLQVLYTCLSEHECPAGWAEFKGRCFLFVNHEKDWADAETYCLERDGNLASFHSRKEFDFIRRLIFRKCGSNTISWLGGYDATKDGVWMWSDGSQFGFCNWANEEPHKNAGREDCMVINHRGEDHVDDVRCSSKYAFVCAKNAKHSCRRH